jgi:hypothetical protein
MEIAAGAMPEILEAWPREMGLIFVSFSMISVERPITERKSKSSGKFSSSNLLNRSK